MELQVKFDSLQENYNDMAVKFSSLNKEKLNLGTEMDKLKVENTNFANISTDRDEAVAKKDEAVALTNEVIESFSTVVCALAAPFKSDYKAPEAFAELKKDFDLYMEKTKALPVGRQSVEGDEKVTVFSANDEIYRSK